MIPFKKIITLLFVVLLAFSCKKKNNDPNPTPQPTPVPAINDNFIKAKIDGVNYEATGSAILADQNSVAFNFRSDISGGGTGIDVSLNGQAAVGTYNCDGSNVTTVGRLNYKSSGTVYSTGICTTTSGTLTITTKNGKTIEGTFNFEAKSATGCLQAPKVITEGTFKITFP